MLLEKFSKFLFSELAYLKNKYVIVVSKATNNKNKEVNAFIFGDMPNRTEEKTAIGKVVDPGPDTKLEITKSSKESVKARSQPVISAGVIKGMVMKKKVFIGGVPKSKAASSKVQPNCLSFVLTMIATYADEKVAWAIQIVTIPLSGGQPET